MKSERGPLTDAALQLSEALMSASDELRKYMPIPFMAEKRKLPPEAKIPGVNYGRQERY
jgi:hypothetical protein